MPADYSDIYNMNPALVMAIAGFSEASKDNNYFEKDATAVLHVMNNRLKRPKRFGHTIQDVIMAPDQFSGVGSKEWDKAYYRKFTDDEERKFKRLLQMANGVLRGTIPDPTGGADHYYNPEIASPDWSRVYQKVYSSGPHDFHSELKPVVSRKTKLTFSQAFAKARKEGKKTFWWRGRKYTTELK